MRVIRGSSVRVGAQRVNATAGGDRGLHAGSGPLVRSC
jgi:hypothetical protein